MQIHQYNATGRNEVAEMLRDARDGGGIVSAVVYGAEWLINMGAGGVTRVTLRP